MLIDLLIALGIAIIITLLIRSKKAITWPGTIAADAMLIFITCMSSLKEALALVGMYFAVFTVDTILKTKIEHATKESHGKGETRGIKQVLANGVAGCVCVLLYKLTGESAFLVAYYASIFEVMADSIASDVGVLSKQAPRDICTWKEVPRGISGGVSTLGFFASGVACLAGGLLVGIILQMKLLYVLIIIIVPYFGMMTDSIIGSKIQVKYTCPVCGIYTEQLEHCGTKTVVSGGYKKISNGTVNTICTVFAACLGYLIAILL